MSTTRETQRAVSGAIRIHDSDDAAWIQSLAGATVGPTHRIVRHLASGGVGHVFLAEHVEFGAHAAVKVPRHDHAAARACVAREAHMLSSLRHRNLVRVLEVGQLADGLPYMLMEYASGLELNAWLDVSGSIKLVRCVGILRQVAAVVDYLRAEGIVHGDIKPANIIVDTHADDHVKLVDFSIAERSGQPSEKRVVMGTPVYMAPEQARGDRCSPASDVYALAALALELITGKPPYDCASPQSALTAVLTQPPMLPSDWGLSIRGLDDVFARGLHADAAARFAAAKDFVDAFEAVAHQAEQQV